jgi:nitroimidazol reductase NimA-like FMN-containing flavoprotein (pyridoxamine 5'-phosphate oxidase superfamily)
MTRIEETPPPSDRARVRRRAQRGVYDRATIHAVLDEGLVAHVGVATEQGPVVIPTGYARVGDEVVLHGSASSRLLRRLRDGAPACVTVTLLDGIVFARSPFNHSMNYRSVVVFGTAREVADPAEKRAALDAFVDHVAPGRAAEARPPTDEELRATLVVALPLDEASAKVRTGPPHDDDVDLDLPIWAGVLPLGLAVGRPEGDPTQDGNTPVPPSVAGWHHR